MANVPLKNSSPNPFLDAIKEASDAVANWPSWKRNRTVFTKPEDQEADSGEDREGVEDRGQEP